MKKILFIGVVAFMYGCGSTETTNQNENTTDSTANEVSTNAFGEAITEENAMSVADFLTQMQGKDSMEVKLIGSIDDVCQKKGCWMDIDAGDAGIINVKFKDYGFFVPKDAAGKQTIVEGMAFLDTVSVEELKHYAKDAEEPDSVINAITEPEINYSIIAKGVIIK